jgi:hypothetical protein
MERKCRGADGGRKRDAVETGCSLLAVWAWLRCARWTTCCVCRPGGALEHYRLRVCGRKGSLEVGISAGRRVGTKERDKCNGTKKAVSMPPAFHSSTVSQWMSACSRQSQWLSRTSSLPRLLFNAAKHVTWASRARYGLLWLALVRVIGAISPCAGLSLFRINPY